MANDEHLKILRQGAKAWNRWREENPDLRPDLSEADLIGANLGQANLIGTDLGRANLSQANLSEANFSYANLSYANLSEANLTGAKLLRAHLSYANLSQANLIGADLSKADLIRADLIGANLNQAKLIGAEINAVDLFGAKLRQANLIGADLSKADLSKADLSQANLRQTILIGANLTGAHLGGAKLSQAGLLFSILCDCDLSAVLDLESVVHHGPSSVGIDTLYRSQGKIPDVFLRGCGVPENLIEYHRSLVTDQAFDFYSCFISYSHADKSFARRLHNDLQARGIRCWLDEHQFQAGDDIYEQIDRGIRLWDKVLLCCSEASLTSWWVDDEIERALKKEQRLAKERAGELQGHKVLALVPLDLDGYLFSGQWVSGKADVVTSRYTLDFKGWEKDNVRFEEQFEKVVQALQVGGREQPPKAKL